MSAPSQLSDGSLILVSLSPLPSSSNQSQTHTKRSHPSHSLSHTHTHPPECSPFLTLGLSHLSGVMSLLIHVRLSAGPQCCQRDAGGVGGSEFGERVGWGVNQACHKVISRKSLLPFGPTIGSTEKSPAPANVSG